jgi:hypothetical protein
MNTPPAASAFGAAGGGRDGSVYGASQPLELILNSEFLFFQRGDAQFIPIGIGHFGLDNILDFSVLIGQMLDMSF